MAEKKKIPGFIKKTLQENKTKAEILQVKLKGESTLYMGDPTLHWGVGGWLRGRANLLYGPRGSGKSSLALLAAAAEQKKTGGYVIIFDSEKYYCDPYEAGPDGELTENAKKFRQRYIQAGLDPDKVVVKSSNKVDELFSGFNELEKDLKEDNSWLSAIVVDSWGGIQSEQAREKIGAGDVAAAGNSFGGNAKTIGPIIQYMLDMFSEAGVTQFYVQHCMANMDQYGPKWLLLGGQKLQFLVHSILFLESSESKDSHLLEGDVQSKAHKDFNSYRIGKKILFRCEKSRSVVEGRKGEFFMNFQDLNFALPEASLFNLGAKLKVFGQNGAWYNFPKLSTTPAKFNGSGAFIKAMQDDKDLYNDVYQACLDSNLTDATDDGAKLGTEAGVGDKK